MLELFLYLMYVVTNYFFENGGLSKIALQLADFIIIPMQGTLLDAEQAGRAIALIKNQEQAKDYILPFSILLTRTPPAYQTRNMSINRVIHIEINQSCFKKNT